MISNREARAAKRAAQAEKRRQEVEKRRREREDQLKREKEEFERQQQLKAELEEERKRQEEQRRLVLIVCWGTSNLISYQVYTYMYLWPFYSWNLSVLLLYVYCTIIHNYKIQFWGDFIFFERFVVM